MKYYPHLISLVVFVELPLELLVAGLHDKGGVHEVHGAGGHHHAQEAVEPNWAVVVLGQPVSHQWHSGLATRFFVHLFQGIFEILWKVHGKLDIVP